MTAQDIIDQLTELASKIRPEGEEPTAQPRSAKRLASIVDAVIKFHETGLPPRMTRLALYSLITGETITSGNNLPHSYCEAMLARWSNEWKANSQSVDEIGILLQQIDAPRFEREFLLKMGQLELEI